MAGARKRPPPPPRREPLWLSEEQAAEARRLLAAGARRDEVAAALGIAVSRLVSRLADQLRDVRVGRGRGGGPRKSGDPTPDEIRERAAEVRSRWTPERWLGRLPGHDRLG